VISLVVFCWFGYYMSFDMPHYTILSIPSPEAATVDRCDWDTTTYSKLTWCDKTSAHYYLWRKETQAYDTVYDPENGYASWDALIQYFSLWLVDHGWLLYDDYSDDPCRGFLPESNFLPRGKNGYVIYRRKNTVRFAAEPTVCVAAWPVEPFVKPVGIYNVVLLTITPSPYAKWYSLLNLVPGR